MVAKRIYFTLEIIKCDCEYHTNGLIVFKYRVFFKVFLLLHQIPSHIHILSYSKAKTSTEYQLMCSHENSFLYFIIIFHEMFRPREKTHFDIEKNTI